MGSWARMWTNLMGHHCSALYMKSTHSVYSFMQLVFIEWLLWTKDWSRLWRGSSEKTYKRKSSHPSEWLLSNKQTKYRDIKNWLLTFPKSFFSTNQEAELQMLISCDQVHKIFVWYRMNHIFWILRLYEIFWLEMYCILQINFPWFSPFGLFKNFLENINFLDWGSQRG